MPGTLRRAAEMESAMWRSLFRWLSRRPLPLADGDVPYSYLGVVKPILGIFIGLSVVEIPILDLIIRNVVPWEPARWIMLAISIWGLLWMLGLYAGLKLHPHLVGDAGIRVRLGTTGEISLPWSDVETVSKRYRTLPSSKSVQVEDDALHIAAGSQTSVDVRLRAPRTFAMPKGETEPVGELRLYVDDPDGFVRQARDVKASADAQAG